MKILRVIATMNPKSGGPCQGIRNSIPVQENMGVINEVVCFDSPDSDYVNKESFKIYALGEPKGPYAYCSQLKTWLLENMTNYKVVIIHGLWLYNSYGTFRVWKELKRKKKTVPDLYVMPHGMLDPYFQKAKSRKLKAIRNLIFWNLFESKVINGSNGLLFTCKQELELAKETFPNYKPKNCLNVGYGIPIPPDKNLNNFEGLLRKCPLLDGKAYWLFLSRIHPKKGVDLLVKAYKRLKKLEKQVPDLLIAGPGLNSTYGKTVQELAGKSSIHFSGMLEGKEKWAAFHFCEAFILPSHQENYGIAVVEAMACEKPVLITDQINIWEEIKSGEAGLIYEDNEDSIFYMLQKWYGFSSQKKQEIGENAGRLFREKFSVEKTAKGMIDLLIPQMSNVQNSSTSEKIVAANI